MRLAGKQRVQVQGQGSPSNGAARVATSTSTNAGRRWRPSRSRIDLGLGHNAQTIFLAMLFNEASFGFYQTLFPLYVESLGASPGVVGLVIGVQGAVRLIFLAPAGILADRIPARRLVVGARSIVIFGVIGYFLAQSWWQLIPAMLLMAAGNVAWPAISKIVADSTDERNRTRAFTLIYTVGPSAALIVSPAIGGFMAGAISLRSIFLAGALSQLVAVFFFSRIQPREISHGHAEKVGYAAALRYRPVAVLCSLQLVMLLVLTIGFTLSPNYLEDVKGLSIDTIGQFGSLIAMCSVLIGIMVAKVKTFSNPLNALLLAIALCPLSFALLIGGSATWVFGLAYFLRGGYMVGWGLFYPTLGEVTPEHLRTRAFALTELLGGAGFALAPFIAGALYEADPTLPLIVALIAAFPLLVAIYFVRRYVAVHRVLPMAAVPEH